MSKHTPGPWKNHGRQQNPGGLPHSAVAADTLLARVYSKHYGDAAEETANANLIASAPQLLEALEHVAASLYYNDYGDPALLDSFDESIIDAAIRAAKGEA